MKFILVLVFVLNGDNPYVYQKGVVSIVHEFNNKTACESARADIIKQMKEHVRVQLCTPKG